MSIDINSTIHGDIVKYAHRTAGDLASQRIAFEHLILDTNYMVEKIIIHNWHTDVFLKGFGDITFNSVMFDNIPVFTGQMEIYYDDLNQDAQIRFNECFGEPETFNHDTTPLAVYEQEANND